MCHAPFVFFSFPLQAIAQWEEDSKERELEKQRPLQDCIFISMVWCCCCGAVAAALLAILKTSFVNKNAPSVRSSMSPYLREKKDTLDKSMGTACFSETSWVGWGVFLIGDDWVAPLGKALHLLKVGPISPLLTWVNGLLSAAARDYHPSSEMARRMDRAQRRGSCMRVPGIIKTRRCKEASAADVPSLWLACKSQTSLLAFFFSFRKNIAIKI